MGREVDAIPSMARAEEIMEKYKLDEDACSKLREIVERRAADEELVLAKIRKYLDSSAHPSSMLCKIARPLIDGESLPDPPEGSRKGGGKDGGGKGGSGSTREGGGGRD